MADMGKLKTFVVFAGNFYYASGGASDLRGSSFDLQLAIEFAKLCYSPDYGEGWWHVLDLSTGVIVARSKDQAHNYDPRNESPEVNIVE
jgi:hypothetical protein